MLVGATYVEVGVSVVEGATQVEVGVGEGVVLVVEGATHSEVELVVVG